MLARLLCRVLALKGKSMSFHSIRRRHIQAKPKATPSSVLSLCTARAALHGGSPSRTSSLEGSSRCVRCEHAVPLRTRFPSLPPIAIDAQLQRRLLMPGDQAVTTCSAVDTPVQPMGGGPAGASGLAPPGHVFYMFLWEEMDTEPAPGRMVPPEAGELSQGAGRPASAAP